MMLIRSFADRRVGMVLARSRPWAVTKAGEVIGRLEGLGPIFAHCFGAIADIGGNIILLWSRAHTPCGLSTVLLTVPQSS